MSSVVTFNRLENQYSYSFESSTQSNDLRLLIDQSDNGLKISIINEKGSEFPVEGYSIRGLPKTSKVPKVFFENAYSNVQKCSDSSYNVSFSVRGLGGWNPPKVQFTSSDGTKLVFNEFTGKISSLSGQQGLYVFINDGAGTGKYAYIGESENLGTRLIGHEQLKRRDHVYLCILAPNTSSDKREAYEEEMIKVKCPYRNTQHATEC
jgi:hypothetical protein